MAYKDFDGLTQAPAEPNTQISLKIDGSHVDLPDSSFIKDADYSRDGADLVLEKQKD